MSIQFEHARKGYAYIPTYKGRSLKEQFARKENYRQTVPKRWVTDGLVEEVRENINDG